MTRRKSSRWLFRNPAAAPLLNTLALLHGRHSEWQRAITDFERIEQLSPSEPQPYIHLGILYAETEDLEAYERNSHEILSRFGESRLPGVLQQLARSCLILPPHSGGLQTFAGWAGVGAARNGNRPRVTLVQNVRGLAEYRSGHFVRARDLLLQLSAQEQEPFRQIESLMVIAMAQQQLGQLDTARVTLAKGLKLVQTNIPKTAVRDLGNQWTDYLVAQVLIHEAKNLIPTQSDNSKEGQ